MTSRPLLPAITAGLAVAAALALSGCSVIEGVLPKPAETRDPQSGEIVGGGSTDVFTLQVGDCLNNDTLADEITEVPTVPCSTAHQYEVYADFELDGDRWPGDEEVTEQADAGCMARFESFVGVPFEESSLDFSFYWPTEESWIQQDDRLVSCLIYDTTDATGSLGGSAR
jgi:hypothetical protein